MQPKETAIERPKVRVSPHGRVNRRHAAIIVGRSEKTLANWASKGIGPRVTMVGNAPSTITRSASPTAKAGSETPR
jgi:hypothetical protein